MYDIRVQPAQFELILSERYEQRSADRNPSGRESAYGSRLASQFHLIYILSLRNTAIREA